MSAPVPTRVVEGDVVAGKFRVQRLLGAGGMGYVVAAENIALGTRVALKLLTTEGGAGPHRLERLRREARAAARIESDHVARVLDVGGLDGATPYIVLEYLDGEDLAALLGRAGALPVPRAVDLLLEACEAIAEAHARGIVHRDLKPANLFLARRADGSEILKVLDFGIAKHCEPEGATDTLTRTNDVLGSPRYMSPEQLRSSGDVTGRCDIWALGVVLFELLTGTPAFVAESVADLAVAILSGPLPQPRALRADIPVALEAAILGCLERDAAKRTATAADLAAKIAPFGTNRARASLEVVRRWGAASASATATTRDGPSASSRAGAFDETLSKSALGTATGKPTSAPTPTHARRGIVVGGAVVVAVTLVGVASRSIWQPAAPVRVTASVEAPAFTPALPAPPTPVELTTRAPAATDEQPAPPPSPTSPAPGVTAEKPPLKRRTPTSPRATAVPAPATPTSAAAPRADPCPDVKCSRK